jgi:hypothetical protein
MKVRQLIALLEADLASGTHEGQSPTIPSFEQAGTVSVAGKSNVSVPPGTLNGVLRQAGLKN